MLIDPNTGQKTLHHNDRGILHQYLRLDNDGTGLFNANLQPNHLGEHEHIPYQITVVFDNGHLFCSWHTATGRQMQGQVRVGQCYIVPNEQPHGLVVERTSELMNFYLTPHWITQAIPESDRGRSLCLGELKIADDPFILQLAATIRNERLRYGKASELLIESTLNVLVSHLVNNYANNFTKPLTTGKLSIRHLTKVRDFIAAEGTKNISIADMAKIVGYSPVHFSRMFKKTTGQTPLKYLIHHRISQAKQLLEKTELPIIEIAYQVGFNSHAYFSTQFRLVTGTTPQNYRADRRTSSFCSFIR
ncbi:helix-turn-helix domain-containing protein [Scytonema sp. UIC 10036]|uniref:helix-turn-helix domain-containing protein n=1 Tax=Scytonema sp. UIC 10036 TaxID=2304196 RepID=UPI0012DAC2F7|nr:AraC family transcriptional regulator [Scytonema sp. UIC 10036]MUH00985.1 helix-turn-helix domain-containing protein [Scytonema sp. UIC 10036]